MYPQAHHHPFFTHVPYSPPPPPPITHKVWILDCKSCDTFLTNRGMKAVLLLRPNVSLYSSDAQPANCSPYFGSDGQAPASSSRRSSSSTPARTCECLTQSLCCHGCGNTVGYMIVVPCTRCTSSINTSNRSTNGHRFVFHSNQIVATERRYIPGESGVKPYDIESPTHPHPMHAASSHSTGLPYGYIPPPPPHDMILPNAAWYSQTSFASSSPPFLGQYGSNPHIVPPPPESLYSSTAQAGYYNPPYHGQPYTSSYQNSPRMYTAQTGPHSHPADFQHPMAPLRPISPGLDNSDELHIPPLSQPFLPFEHKEQPIPRRLAGGEHLYWHHLARNGEMSGVRDDDRARRPWTPESSESGANLLGIKFDR
ncbi:hypothetical protein FA15DRAFT_707806 [Coprinopsis marcescibilis]|uniref:Uncharacterized protein n=1 Tax=Coprinopsis marcescibilis TaxID=230819 RepID=A0A5C3KKU3_COPMA|nr:hypothetical protein FA15DRAFT_707806 [Coprinopsis marcescibilis]